MNVVDSCGWLEYFADGPNASFFAPAIEDTRRVIVPSICLLEVFRRVLHQKNKDAALQAVAVMQQGKTVNLDKPLALLAAELSLELRLPLADSVVLATARAHNAVVWTQDSDFKGLEGVKYKARHP